VADFTADKPSYTALLVQLPSGARVTEVVFNSIPYAPRVSRTGRLRGAALPAADRAQSALSRAAGPQFQREALHSRRSLHSSGPAAPSADWTFHNGILRLGVSLRARNRLVVRYEPRILFASPLEEILQHPLIENGRASCAIVVAEKAPERDRISAQRLAAYVEYYLRRQAKPDVFCWSLTGEAEGLCPPILESGFVVGNGRRAVPMTSGVVGDGGGTTVPDYKRNGTTVPDYKRDGTTVPDYKLILIGGPACFGLEKAVSVPAGGGIVRFVDWRGHRALLVTGADDRRTEEAVLRLLRVFDERYPFFGALSEGGFYQRAGLSGGVLEDEG
jgi:hypothetical protein